MWLTLDAPATAFSVQGKKLSVLCGRELLLVDVPSAQIQTRKTVFEKDGFARFTAMNEKTVVVSDFTRVYAFSRCDFSEKGSYVLGEDLTSDVCSLYADEKFAYAGIRNGSLARIDLESGEVSRHVLSDSSSWAITGWKDKLLCGTVGGALVMLSKETMEKEACLQVSKQNLRSLCVCEDTLYIASQDKRVYEIDLPRFSLVRKSGILHQKMFDIAGKKDGRLYTVSHPCGEISVWDEDFTRVSALNMPLRLSGSSCIKDNALLLSSRGFFGVERLDLDKI